MADELPPTPDPFAAIGGGVYQNGGWIPKGQASSTTVAATPGAPNPRTNFKWGSAGVGTEGVDWGNTNNWTDAQWREYEQKYGLVSPGAPAAGGGATPPPPPGATGGSAPQVQSAYTDVLTNILRGPTPEAYAAGAAKGPEAAGYRIANRRELDRQVAQNAEESAYSGVSNVGGRERQMRAKAAEGEAQFIGNLTTQRMQDRRAELFQAMQLAASQGDSAAARELQLKLAQMDAALKEKGIASQEALGGQDIALRRELGQGDLALRKLLGLSGIGFDYANLQQRANQDAYQSLLQ